MWELKLLSRNLKRARQREVGGRHSGQSGHLGQKDLGLFRDVRAGQCHWCTVGRGEDWVMTSRKPQGKVGWGFLSQIEDQGFYPGCSEDLLESREVTNSDFHL